MSPSTIESADNHAPAITSLIVSCRDRGEHVYAIMDACNLFKTADNVPKPILMAVIDRANIGEVLRLGASIIYRPYNLWKGPTKAAATAVVEPVQLPDVRAIVMSVPYMLHDIANSGSASAAIAAMRMLGMHDVPVAVRYYLHQALMLKPESALQQLQENARLVLGSLRVTVTGTEHSTLQEAVLAKFNDAASRASLCTYYHSAITSYMYMWHLRNGSYPVGSLHNKFGAKVAKLVQKLRRGTVKAEVFRADDEEVQTLLSFYEADLMTTSLPAVIADEQNINCNIEFRHEHIGQEGKVRLTSDNIADVYCYDTYVARYSTSRIRWTFSPDAPTNASDEHESTDECE
jgi:hypothetical protein